MGTRHSIIVIVDKKTKVAQYGQWDGSPSGVGCELLTTLLSCDLNDLKEKCKTLKSLTEKQVQNKWKEVGDVSEKFKELYPHLSRDCSSDILQHILSGVCKEVSLDKQFPGNSLFCEWAYVIDFDKNSFEIYEGFNKDILTPEDRFFPLQNKIEKFREEYKPVKLWMEFKLNDLPTLEVFESLVSVEDEEEEDLL